MPFDDQGQNTTGLTVGCANTETSKEWAILQVPFQTESSKGHPSVEDLSSLDLVCPAVWANIGSMLLYVFAVLPPVIYCIPKHNDGIHSSVLFPRQAPVLI
jgi:hypothetical protein